MPKIDITLGPTDVVELGKPKHTALEAELLAALKVIASAMNDSLDGFGGSFFPARKFLDDRGVFNGDLNELRVLYAVAKTAIAKAEPK